MRDHAIASGEPVPAPVGRRLPVASPPSLFDYPQSIAMHTLQRARATLGGMDDAGHRIGPSMFDPDVISFAHGEGVRRPCAAAIAAGVRALLDSQKSSLDNYLFLQRLDALDDAITRQFCRIGVPVSIAKHVVLDAGVSRLFSAFLQIATTPGDLLLTHPGFYHPLVQWCHNARVHFECLSCDAANDFKLSAHVLRAWADRQRSLSGRLPRMLAIFNPTMAGALYSQDELDDIAAVVADWGAWAIEDCIFADTEFDDRPYGKLAACEAIQERVITLCGASKAYSLANIRAGWACAPEPIARRLQAHVTGQAATLPQVMKFMSLAALNAPRTYLETNTREVIARVGLVQHLVQIVNNELPAREDARPWIDVALHPQAGHSVLLDFSAVLHALQGGGCTLTDSIDLVRWTLDTAKVAFSPGASNGWTGGLVRCVHACVGAEFTYEASAEAEQRAALRAIDGWAGRDSGCLPKSLRVADEPAIEGISAGFEAGRERIRRAFLDRLLPGLRVAVQGHTPARFFFN